MPVGKWNAEIQQGVYNMTCLCVEMIAIRLNKTTEVPEILLETLNLVHEQHTKINNIPILKELFNQLASFLKDF